VKSQIDTTVDWAIDVPADEAFEVTGRESYGTVDYTVAVFRVREAKVRHLGKPDQRGVAFIGTRVLRNGSMSHQTKVIHLPDGDPQIPAAVAERVAELRAKVDELRELIGANL